MPPRVLTLARGFLCAAMLAALATGVEAAPGSIRLSEVKPGETVEITYQMLGCFTFDHARFVFSPQGAGEFAVSELRSEPNQKTTAFPLGRIVLESGERERLDRLLDHYRSPPKPEEIVLIGHVHVHLVQRRGAKVIREETLNDQLRNLEGESLHFAALLAAARKVTR